MGYSFRLAARVLLYAQSHRQGNTYHSLCYTSRGALAGTRNCSMKDRSDDPSHHERTLLPRSYISLPSVMEMCMGILGSIPDVVQQITIILVDIMMKMMIISSSSSSSIYPQLSENKGIKTGCGSVCSWCNWSSNRSLIVDTELFLVSSSAPQQV